MKNKEQERENRKELIGWDHIVNLAWDEKTSIALAFGDWPTGYTAFLVKQSIYRDMIVI